MSEQQGILVGYKVPSGEPKYIRPFHTVITGQTQYSGKTTTIKAMAVQAANMGYKVLIFDTKETGADYENFGTEVPAVVRDTLDSLELLHLLESIMRTKLTHYYSTLSELCIGGPHVKEKGKAKNLQEIADRAFYLSEHTNIGFIQGAARTIWDLLGRLIDQTKGMKTVPKLKLHDGVNRMVLNDLKPESQQIVMAAAFEDLLGIYKRGVFAVIDEAFKFVPQRHGSAATWVIDRYITQGASKGLFILISTQFLALTNKDPLKACPVKVLGTQDVPTEQDPTLELDTSHKLTRDQIFRLKIGHFYIITKEEPDPEQVYIKPYDMDEETARKIAMGTLPMPKATRPILAEVQVPLFPPKEVEDDWSDVIRRIEKLEALVV